MSSPSEVDGKGTLNLAPSLVCQIAGDGIVENKGAGVREKGVEPGSQNTETDNQDNAYEACPEGGANNASDRLG